MGRRVPAALQGNRRERASRSLFPALW